MSELATVLRNHTLEKTYIEGIEFFDEVCSEICKCQMSIQCKGCRIFLMANNYEFHYNMSWLSLMQKELEMWRKSKNLISRVKKEHDTN